MLREYFVAKLMTAKRRAPIQRKLDFLVPLLTRLSLTLTLSLLFLLPLARGGGAPWALPAALGLQFLAYSMWGIGRWLKREIDPIRWHWSLAIPLSLALLAKLHLLPLGPLVRLVSPAAASAWQQFNASGVGSVIPRLSLNPGEANYYAQFFLLCFLLAFFLYNRCRQADSIVLLALTIVGSALFNATLAFLPFFSGSALFSDQHVPVEILRGTFPNRNHFALFMGIGAQLSLGLLLAFFPIKVEYLRKPDLMERLLTPVKGLFLFALLLLTTAQIFSLSRGGALSTIPVLTVFFLGWLFFRKIHITAKRTILAANAILLCSLFLAMATALPRLSERYKNLTAGVDLSSNDRILVWKESLNLLKAHWLTGSGLGSYTDTISRYESGLFPFALTYSAHNDWLELCCEIGLPLAFLLFASFFFLLYERTRRLRFQEDDKLRDLGTSCLAAITTVMIHELVDYNLRALANAVTFTATCTLLLLCTKISHPEPARRPLLWVRHANLASSLLFLVLTLSQFANAYAGLQQEIISRHLQPAQDGYALSHKDYEHLATTARRALRFALTPNPDLHRQYAIATANAIASGNAQDNAESTFATALVNMRIACRLRPFNGDFHLTHAQIAEQAALHTRQVSEKQILDFYQMAAYSYCHQTAIIKACADAYLRSWLRMSASPLTHRETLPIARNLTLQAYADFMRIAPADSSRALAALWQIAPDPATLLSLAPEHLLVQEALCHFLLNRQAYNEARQTLAIWEKLNRLRPEQEKLDRLSWAEKQKQETRTRDQLQYEITRQKLLLMGLTGEWNTRAKLLPELPALLDLAQTPMRQNVQRLIDHGDFTRANDILNRAALQAPLPDQTRLLEARLKQLLGKGDDMVALLTHFAYVPNPVATDTLQRCLTLLQQHTPLLQEKFFPRHRFLKVALALRLAENGAISAASAPLREWLDELQSLHEWNQMHSNHAWIQRHLVPFYIGRLHELAGRLPQAAAAYQDALAISPNNLYVLQRLAAIPGPAGDAARLTLQKWSGEHVVNCRFDSAITLYALKATPDAIARSDQSISIEYLWLCESDPREDGQIAVSFRTPDTVIFNDTFSFIHSEYPMVAWRVGEIQPTTRTFPPLLEAVKQGMPFRSQAVTAHVSMAGLSQQKIVRQPLPPAAFPLFSFTLPERD